MSLLAGIKTIAEARLLDKIRQEVMIPVSMFMEARTGQCAGPFCRNQVDCNFCSSECQEWAWHFANWGIYSTIRKYWESYG